MKASFNLAVMNEKQGNVKMAMELYEAAHHGGNLDMEVGISSGRRFKVMFHAESAHSVQSSRVLQAADGHMHFTTFKNDESLGDTCVPT